MIVLNVETTGIDPLKHSITEIGALDFANPSNRFYGSCKILEGAEVSEFALKITGKTLADLTNSSRPMLEETMNKFNEWQKNIEDVTIVGQNAKFDLTFINEAYRIVGLKSPFGYRVIDLHSLTCGHILSRERQIPLKVRSSDVSGDFIMEYVGIPIEPRPFNAKDSIVHGSEAFSRLTRGKNLLEQFKEFPVPYYLKK